MTSLNARPLTAQCHVQIPAHQVIEDLAIVHMAVFGAA
jgi:hypothetical protein